jgi:hypothetical protein
MVGAVNSFVKVIVVIFCIQSVCSGSSHDEAAIGRLTGFILRVSMPRCFNVAILHINSDL